VPFLKHLDLAASADLIGSSEADTE